MFNLFIKKPILIQIDRFCGWRGSRYPTAASRDKEILIKFSRKYKVRHVEEVTQEHIDAFIDTENSSYLRTRNGRTVAAFLRYSRTNGYIEFTPDLQTGIIPAMPKIDPRIHVHQIQRIRKLREDGLSFRAIKALMESEDGRIYNISSVHRWFKYQLPEGLELSTG